MTHKLTITIPPDDIDKIIRDELISAFGTLEADIELTNAFARVIRYYTNDKQWRDFLKSKEDLS